MNIINNAINYFLPSYTRIDLCSKKEESVPAHSVHFVTLENAPLYKNCIHFELLIVLNFANALKSLQKELFFAQNIDHLSVLNAEIQWVKETLNSGNHEKLGEVLQKTESLRILLIQEAHAILGEKTQRLFDDSFALFFITPCNQAKDKICQIEKELSTTLFNCWQNRRVPEDIKKLVGEFLQIIEELKEQLKEMKIPFETMSDEDIDNFHAERMELEDYAKCYQVMNDLSLLLGEPTDPLWKSPKRVLGYISLLVKPDAWLKSLEQSRNTFRETLETIQREIYGKNFTAVMRWQKLSIIQDTWLRTLQQLRTNTLKEHDAEKSFRYTCMIMRALSTEKLQFYQHFFSNGQSLTCASLKKLTLQKKVSLENLKEEVQRKEEKIDQEEVALKCYSWKLACFGFSWTAITDNIFFRLGKEFFLMSERISPGVKLQEPFLSGFSYLAGGAVLGSRIYFSPTVAGPALVIHALAQAYLSDVKRVNTYGNAFSLTEEQTLQAHSKLMLASTFGVSTLMFGTSNIFQLGVSFGSSAITSHYAEKTFKRYCNPPLKPGTPPSPAHGTTRLMVAIGANTLGFMLGNYAWSIGSDLYFDHFSNESILFNDELCNKFKKKCLAQAYEELGASENTPFSEMKSLYYQQSLNMHPDKTQEINADAFERINSAWTIIKKAQKNTIN